jgi:hypothetical protein
VLENQGATGPDLDLFRHAMPVEMETDHAIHPGSGKDEADMDRILLKDSDGIKGNQKEKGCT